ncbi:MAG: putative metal-dependent hydrolase [bacterium]|nr:putative metal-dependent hydrolase [bacterium]
MLTPQEKQALIAAIRALPDQLEALVSGLTDVQLTTRYLPGEWTVAQNVHHVADSHMNAYIRTRFALTQEHPTIMPYDQDAWAELADVHSRPVSDSILLLRGLHARWAALFESLDDAALARAFLHPANGVMTIEAILRSYAAHGKEHQDQIQRTLAAAG